MDKLYFTKDIVDDSFVPKNRKPKPISKPAALMGSKDTRTMLNFAYTLCSSAMFVSDVLGVGYGQVFCVQCLFVLRVARKHGLV